MSVPPTASSELRAPPPAGLSPAAFGALLDTFGFDATRARLIGRSQNFVYEVTRAGTPLIARVSTARHRTRPEIEAELQWVEFLHGRGLPVCAPLLSRQSRRCEEAVVADGSYILAAFEKAAGRTPARVDLTSAFCRRIGELIGQMHRAAIAASESGRRFAREDWRASRLLTHDLAATTAPALAEFQSSVAVLIKEIAAIPPHVFNFGLIHADVNSGNCHLDGDRLWLFDFDNCEYGYFLQDLAVMLYDTLYSKWVKHVAPDQLTAFVRSLWHALLSGYREAGPALAIEPDALRRFFLLREAIIYIHYHRIFPASQLAADPYVMGMKRNVETRTHALDFERLMD